MPSSPRGGNLRDSPVRMDIDQGVKSFLIGGKGGRERESVCEEGEGY